MPRRWKSLTGEHPQHPWRLVAAGLHFGAPRGRPGESKQEEQANGDDWD